MRLGVPKIPVARLLAEFSVIVIGVLVALGVESWREDVAERALEYDYLQRLETEFKNDYLRITTAIEARSVQQGHIDNALKILEVGGSNGTDDLLSVFMASRSVWSRQIGATFQELIGSGRLRIVSNADLRIRLVGFYSWINVAIVDAPGLRDRMSYRDIVRGEIDPQLQESLRACGGAQARILALPDTNMVETCEYAATPDEAAIILDRIRSDPDAIRALRRWAAAFSALEARLEEAGTRITEMKLLISEEVARH
jgi:hypothetical protein